MKKTQSLLAAFGAAVLMLGSDAAMAQFAKPPAEPDRARFYVGVMGGNAVAKEDACAFSGMSCDRRGQIWGGFGGLMLNRHFGMEAGYRTLGKIVEQDDPATGNHMWVRTRAGDLVAIGALPVNRLTVYGKFGGYWAKSRLTSSFQNSDENTSRGWTYGAGLSFDVLSHFAVRLDWQRFNNVQGINFTADIEAVTLGALIKF